MIAQIKGSCRYRWRCVFTWLTSPGSHSIHFAHHCFMLADSIKRSFLNQVMSGLVNQSNIFPLANAVLCVFTKLIQILMHYNIYNQSQSKTVLCQCMHYGLNASVRPPSGSLCNICPAVFCKCSRQNGSIGNVETACLRHTSLIYMPVPKGRNRLPDSEIYHFT